QVAGPRPGRGPRRPEAAAAGRPAPAHRRRLQAPRRDRLGAALLDRADPLGYARRLPRRPEGAGDLSRLERRLMTLLALPVAHAFLVSLATAHAGELPRAEPEAVGLSAGRIADLKPALQKIVDEGKIAGEVALARASARWPTSCRSGTARWRIRRR